MCANCSEARRQRAGQRGFTLIELVMVMVLVGIVAVTVMPKLGGITALRGNLWRDQVLAALRHAHSQAASHRRLVCMTITSGRVQLAMASDNPGQSCTANLAGPNADPYWAHDEAAPATATSAGGPLYFQPNGRVTLDGAGASVADITITIAGETSIVVVGQTGHAR